MRNFNVSNTQSEEKAVIFHEFLDHRGFGYSINQNGVITYIGSLKNNVRDGYGIQFEENGDKPVYMFEGNWKNGKKGYGVEYYTIDSMIQSEKKMLYSIKYYNLYYIQTLKIANNCYNEETEIKWRKFMNLTTLEIGDNSCMNVGSIGFYNLCLTHISIGKNCFMRSDSGLKFIVTCPKLKSIIIKQRSFRYYSIFSINCPFCKLEND